ncbi:PH domain-containing protein [Nocardioides litoris]|uniref:PH domain-containing protein n=1 Tax=Nocardioides litoris TaxID=1926648 RepID=UPI001FE4AF95|nr:PH domain-containing protein [Nocardioides litoris]
MNAPAHGLDLPRTWRPLGPRIAGIFGGGSLVAIMTVLWLQLDQDVRDSVTGLQRGIVIAAFLGGFACLYALVRSRATARPDGLTVVNGYRRREYEYAEIVAVRLPPGAPWVTLDLANGETASVMGIQGSDGSRATTAVRELRAIVDDAHTPRD